MKPNTIRKQLLGISRSAKFEAEWIYEGIELNELSHDIDTDKLMFMAKKLERMATLLNSEKSKELTQ